MDWLDSGSCFWLAGVMSDDIYKSPPFIVLLLSPAPTSARFEAPKIS
jgi:hypothetical protein